MGYNALEPHFSIFSSAWVGWKKEREKRGSNIGLMLFLLEEIALQSFTAIKNY
jgi:hypothetical protein